MSRATELVLATMLPTSAPGHQVSSNGDLDLALSALPVRNPDIVCSELVREPLFLAVAEKHPLARESAIDLQNLQDQRRLLLKEGHCLHDDVLMTCTNAKRSFVRCLELTSLPVSSSWCGRASE